MSWEKNEQALCRMILERKIATGVDSEDEFESFQGFVAAARSFEKAGLIQGLKTRNESMTGRSFIIFVSWQIPAAEISTKQRQWLILRFFATMSKEDATKLFPPTEDHFCGLAGNLGQISLVCAALAERGSIVWHSCLDGGGSGRISSRGMLEVEFDAQQPTTSSSVVNIDNRNQSISVGTVKNSGELALGHNARVNKEVLAHELSALLQAIQSGHGSQEEKQSVRRVLGDFLKHPLVVAITGGLAGTISGLIDQ